LKELAFRFEEMIIALKEDVNPSKEVFIPLKGSLIYFKGSHYSL